MGTTAGSASQGWVERTDLKMRSRPSIELPINPTVELYVVCPGAVLAASLYEIRVGVGLRLKMPQNAAGIRT
jgi:hypothetical protein